MTARADRSRRALKAVVTLACLVPITAGAAGVVLGTALVTSGAGAEAIAGQTNLDSHFRYLSGLLLGLGMGFLWTVATIERQGTIFRLLALPVVAGGLARAASLLDVGQPAAPHLLALGIELGLVPLLVVWQARVAKECRGKGAFPQGMR